jgi:hypothetical protein
LCCAGTVCSGTPRAFGANEASAACRGLGFLTGTAHVRELVNQCTNCSRTCEESSPFNTESSCRSYCTGGSCQLSWSDYRYRCCNRCTCGPVYSPSWLQEGTSGSPMWLNNVWCTGGNEVSLEQVRTGGLCCWWLLCVMHQACACVRACARAGSALSWFHAAKFTTCPSL